jgi:Ca2+-binding RTX toxin-like protein
MVNMNMIFNGPGISANGTQNKENVSADTTALGKMITAWETKQKSAKKLGGFGLLAVTLAACNNDDDSSASSSVDATPYDDAYVATQVAAATAAAEAAAATAATAAAATAAAAAPAAAAEAAAAAATQTAYDALVAPKTLTLTNSTTADNLLGGQGDDTITGAFGTLVAADVVRDNSTVDNDTLTIIDGTAAGAAATFQNIENIDFTVQSLTAGVPVLADNYSGVSNLTVTRGDVTIGGTVLTTNKAVNIDNVDSADIAKITIGAGTTTVNVDQTPGAGVTIDADAASGAVTIVGAANVNAAGQGAGDTLSITALTTAQAGGTAALEAAANAKAMDLTTNAATVTIANGAGGETLDGVMTINAPAASTVTVPAAGGGVTINALGGAGALGVDVRAIDVSGATIATTVSSPSTASQNIDIGGVNTAGDVSAATIKAVGTVALDVGIATTAVDALTLEGNGAAVTYVITSSNGALTSIAATSDVTISAASTLLTAKTITGSPASINLTSGAAAIAAGSWGTNNIGLSYNNGGNAITAATGQSFTFTSATQTGLDFDFSAATTDGSMTITAGDVNGALNSTVGTLALTTLDTVSAGVTSGTVTIVANDANLTATTSSTFGTLQNIVISGDEDVNLGTVATANSIDASASTGIITATLGANAKAITGGTGADQITLNNGTRAHTVDGGAGIDTFTITATAVGASINGNAGNDIFNIADADTLVLLGGAGNDTFNMNANTINSTIIGGEGTDIMAFDAGAANVGAAFTAAGIESLNISAVNNTVTFTHGQFAGLTSSIVTGDGAADVILVNVGTGAAGGTLDASGLTKAALSTSSITYAANSTGSDIITGGVAAETFNLDVIRGADQIEGGATGIDLLTSSDTTVTETGSAASTGVVLNMGTSNVTSVAVLTNVGDYLAGGVNAVVPGTMAYIFNGIDAATPVNSSIVDTISGIENFTSTDAAGVEYVVGSDAANVLTLGAGDDYANGGPGADTILGEAGADTLLGGDGADTITGGTGIDTITGGNGIDKISYFATTATANANNVTDFTYGTGGDIMQFSDASLGVDVGAFTAGTAIATTTVNAVALGRDVVNEIIVDTIANLGALGVTIGDESGNANNVYQIAIASDTGAIFYDVNGDWSAGSVQIGDLNNSAVTLVPGNFEIIA